MRRATFFLTIVGLTALLVAGCTEAQWPTTPASDGAFLPVAVSDLSVAETGPDSVVLEWTEVPGDSTNAADYQVWQVPSPMEENQDEARVVTDGTCASPYDGSSIGATASCTVRELDPDARYDFQLRSFRTDSSGGRIYSLRPSNVATGQTPASEEGGSGGALHPSEPEGFTPITETSFTEAPGKGWSAAGDHFRIVSDADAPVSPDRVARARYPAGWSGGYSPVSSESRITGAGVRELYVSFWLKVSENWQGHPINDKLMYLWTHQKPVVFPVYVGGGSNALTTEIRIQDVPDGGRHLVPNINNPEIRRGQWHHWEIHVSSNNGDAADGEIHWWIDGQKVGEHSDVRFGRSGHSKVWDYVAWRPVWGGAGSTVRQDQYMWVDHIYVSGSR